MGDVTMKVAGRVAGGCVVLSPSHPDVLARLPRRSPDDSGVPRSAPPGRPLAVTPAPPATSAPPAIFIYEREV